MPKRTREQRDAGSPGSAGDGSSGGDDEASFDGVNVCEAASDSGSESESGTDTDSDSSEVVIVEPSPPPAKQRRIGPAEGVPAVATVSAAAGPKPAGAAAGAGAGAGGGADPAPTPAAAADTGDNGTCSCGKADVSLECHACGELRKCDRQAHAWPAVCANAMDDTDGGLCSDCEEEVEVCDDCGGCSSCADGYCCKSGLYRQARMEEAEQMLDGGCNSEGYCEECGEGATVCDYCDGCVDCEDYCCKAGYMERAREEEAREVLECEGWGRRRRYRGRR